MVNQTSPDTSLHLPTLAGELFGAEYPYHQTGLLFTTTDNDQLVAQIDEEFGDVDELVDDQKLIRPSVDEDPITVAPPADHESEEEEVEYTHV